MYQFTKVTVLQILQYWFEGSDRSVDNNSRQIVDAKKNLSLDPR